MPDGNASIQALAYDRIHKKTVLFGGFYGWGGGDGDQTWVFDYTSKTWTQRNPSQHPSSRGWASFDFHQKLGKFVLFGGAAYGGPIQNDTWLYDYTANTWTEIFPDNPPPARTFGNMVYDPNNEVMVLFGGRAGNYKDKGPTLSDTWILDLEKNQWVQMNPASPPSGTKVYKPAFDPVNNVFIIVKGGERYSTETWVYRYLKGTAKEKKKAKDRLSRALDVSPNPFSTWTEITLSSKFKVQGSKFKVEVVSPDGSIVEKLEGQSSVKWSATRHAPGMYLIRAVIGNKTYSKKIVLLR
jgi:hypothetical protein